MARAIVMPSTGMYTAEGKLLTWLYPNGAAVHTGDAIAEVETEKSVFEIEAPEGGVLQQVAEVGTVVAVEQLLGYVLRIGEPVPERPSISPTAPVSQNVRVITRERELRASPLAKRLAAEHNLDLHNVAASGPGGRIVEADVLAAVAAGRNKVGQSTAPAPDTKVVQRIPLTGMRRTIADQMRHSLAHAASLTLTRELRAACVVDFREACTSSGHELSFDAVFIKLLAAGLCDYPMFNSLVENDTIVMLPEIHIGFAVAIPNGLIVPVIRDAATRPLMDVAATVRDLGQRALGERLRPAEVCDATASITNLGAYGVDAFTPILNPPQSVILGIGRILQRPVADNGQLTVAPTVILSLTFDHRVADGAPAAQLLDSICTRANDRKYLEALVEK